MILFFTLFLLLFTGVFTNQHVIFDNKELNRELRNYLCCKNKMKCCNSESPHFRIRAILTKCAAKDEASPQEEEQPASKSPEEDDQAFRSKVTSCKKKIMITIKIESIGISPPKTQFVILDHVYDTVTEKNQKLFNPYVIKLKLQQVSQTYGLKFINYVNSEAKEVVYNKHDGNYTGCKTDMKNPTCGLVTYNGKVIPYCQGFCCSCDNQKNLKIQPQTGTVDSSEIPEAYSDPAHLLDGTECLPDLNSEGNFKKRTGMKRSLGRSRNKNSLRQSHMRDRFRKVIFKRQLEDDVPATTKECLPTNQILSGGVQIRGGQNCADRYTPPGLDPESYHESTHCLRFSDLWYSIYQLQQPILEHEFSIKMYEKQQNECGEVLWRDLTDGKSVEVGTFSRFYIDDQKTISFYYKSSPSNPKKIDYSLNYKTDRLLIPEEPDNCDRNKYPELNGGAEEYLILRSDKINLEGDQCNIPGVGFEAFYKQPNRCSVPKGSCLANQPRHLWKHDSDAFKVGGKGCFFLKNYANIADVPIRRNASTGDSYLRLQYTGKFVTSIEIEASADSNLVLRPQSSAVITAVYTDSTCTSKTVITTKVTNTGLISGKYLIRLSDCSTSDPRSFNKVETDPVLIPPQHQHVFHLEIKCQLPSEILHCSVEVLNTDKQLLALRRIKLQKSDRCICIWYCACACIGTLNGLKCNPLSLEHYHAAGFQGGLPIPTTLIHNTHLDELISLVFYVILFIILTLLLLGLLKAILGLCCCPSVGTWGLSVLLDLPSDDVSEDGSKKKIRSTSRTAEFCINVVFFFTFPVVLLILLCRRLCCSRSANATSKSSTASTTRGGKKTRSKTTEEEICLCDECESEMDEEYFQNFQTYFEETYYGGNQHGDGNVQENHRGVSFDTADRMSKCNSGSQNLKKCRECSKVIDPESSRNRFERIVEATDEGETSETTISKENDAVAPSHTSIE